MAITLLTPETVDQFEQRLRAIPADATPRFGKLQPAQMVRHLRHVVELSLEEAHEKDISNVFTRRLVRPLIFHVWTSWPKAKVKAPDSFTPEPEGDLEAERELLIAALHRFVEAQKAQPERVTPNPAFGPMTLAYWGRSHGVHFEHHLRQYGV